MKMKITVAGQDLEYLGTDQYGSWYNFLNPDILTTIVKKIGINSFKAHDLLLDQTVRVRQALLASQSVLNIWREQVQQLALVRHPNFLNILDVVSDNSGYFVITESPQGQSIAELLRERSRFDVEDVLALLTPLAGALDLAASFACCANSISARWLFAEKRQPFAGDAEQRRFSEWAPSLVKIDVWELVRPRKIIHWSSPTSIAQSEGSRKLAIKQAALLTYELLGGEKENREGELERWFEPVYGLGDAGNAVLYRGLRGSQVFDSSGNFIHRLESAIQSCPQESKALPEPALSTHENSVSLPGTSAVIRGFNRDTGWLATGVLGVLVFASLVLAVLVQEHYPEAVDPTAAVQARGNRLLNANISISTPSKEVGVSGKSSTDETTPAQASGVDQAVSEVSQKENRTAKMEAAAATPTPVLALTPEIKHINAQVAASLRSLKITRARSSRPVRPKFDDVKMRLIALWHQSLRSERTRTWTPFSNLNTGGKKKVVYTAQTSH